MEETDGWKREVRDARREMDGDGRQGKEKRREEKRREEEEEEEETSQDERGRKSKFAKRTPRYLIYSVDMYINTRES
jgi:hypothetical protein